jgi:hypothetical protein
LTEKTTILWIFDHFRIKTTLLAKNNPFFSRFAGFCPNLQNLAFYGSLGET